MTNQIEAAIVALIQQHAAKPEIDYAILADQIFDKVCDNVDYDAIKERVIESLDIDASDVARRIDSSDIACDIDLTDLASEIDLDSLANEIPMGDLATNICKQTLAEHIDLSDIVARVKDAVAANIAEQISERTTCLTDTVCNLADTVCDLKLRIADLEAKLAQPQPQPQPSTPTQMIERAKNLLADALGMLSNPTA